MVEKFIDKLPIMGKSETPVFELNKTIPIVSVIIPIYNYGQQFEKTLSFGSTQPF